MKGAHHQTLRALNPNRLVPMLVDGDLQAHRKLGDP